MINWANFVINWTYRTRTSRRIVFRYRNAAVRLVILITSSIRGVGGCLEEGCGSWWCYEMFATDRHAANILHNRTVIAVNSIVVAHILLGPARIYDGYYSSSGVGVLMMRRLTDWRTGFCRVLTPIWSGLVVQLTLSQSWLMRNSRECGRTTRRRLLIVFIGATESPISGRQTIGRLLKAFSL